MISHRNCQETGQDQSSILQYLSKCVMLVTEHDCLVLEMSFFYHLNWKTINSQSFLHVQKHLTTQLDLQLEPRMDSIASRPVKRKLRRIANMLMRIRPVCHWERIVTPTDTESHRLVRHSVQWRCSASYHWTLTSRRCWLHQVAVDRTTSTAFHAACQRPTLSGNSP